MRIPARTASRPFSLARVEAATQANERQAEGGRPESVDVICAGDEARIVKQDPGEQKDRRGGIRHPRSAQQASCERGDSGQRCQEQRPFDVRRQHHVIEKRSGRLERPRVQQAGELRVRTQVPAFGKRPDGAAGNVLLGNRQMVPVGIAAHVERRHHQQIERHQSQHEQYGSGRLDEPPRQEQARTEFAQMVSRRSEVAPCRTCAYADHHRRPRKEKHTAEEPSQTSEENARSEHEHAERKAESQSFTQARRLGKNDLENAQPCAKARRRKQQSEQPIAQVREQ